MSVSTDTQKGCRIAVCDNEGAELAAILSLIGTYKENAGAHGITTYGFSSGAELLSAVNTGGEFDIYLLDIIIPGQDGIALAREIREINPDVPIIFLTSSADYALEAFGVFAFSYILKPVDSGKLFAALDKAVASVRREDESFLLFSAHDKPVKIPFSSIICVELYNRSLRLFHENGDVLVSKTIRTPFETGVAPLLADSRFLRARKSHVLNMAHVEALTAGSFIMRGELEITVPRYWYSEAKAKYLRWLSERGMIISGVKLR